MINCLKSDKNEKVWQMYFRNFGSCVYLIELKNKKILIDTGSPETINELQEDLKKLNTSPDEIDIVILTHNHWDHVGGGILFLNSKFYGSKKDFGENVLGLESLKKEIPEFKIIETPGHSKGGICILYKDILFSGDTIFHEGGIGRMDLPGGSEEDMKKSLEELKNINYKILAPGHI
ncbi:MBL fold metallo-hydrolase [Candidatus Pacearchaeota archaeon]|nr:MBL fold metallo-hydrolase [Candidatus Pacearchaeota archaeon]